MKYVFASLTLASCLVSTEAGAETDGPVWTLSATGSWSEIDSSDRDAVSGSFSLSHLVGEGSIGASITTSNGSDVLFETAEVTDRSSVYGSVWVVFPLGAAFVDLTVSYGQEDYDGQVVLEDSRFEALNGSTVDLVSEVDSLAVSATRSRTFISGDWDIIPNASLGWSQSEATTTAAALDEAFNPTALGEEQNGLTATAGLGGGYVASEQLYLFADLVGLYAENGASTGIVSTSRLDFARASSRQDTDEAAWAEVSIGASLFATDTVTLSVVGGMTVGRDQEEVFASTTLSFAF